MHRSGTSALTGALGRPGPAAAAGRRSRGRRARQPGPLRERDRWSTSRRRRSSTGWAAGGTCRPRLDPGWAASRAGPGRGPRRRPGRARRRSSPVPGPNLWKDPRLCLLLPYWRRLLGEPGGGRAHLARRRRPWRARSRPATAHPGRRRARPLGAVQPGGPGRPGRAPHLRHRPPVAPGRPRWRLLAPGRAGSPTQGVAPAGDAGWDVRAGAADSSPRRSTTTARATAAPAARAPWPWPTSCLARGAHASIDAPVPGPPSRWSAALLSERRRAFLELRTELLTHRELSEAHRTLVGRAPRPHPVRGRPLRTRHRPPAPDRPLRVEVVELQEQLQLRARERDEWQRLATRVGDELDRVRASTSWRVTAPLRAIGDASRREPEVEV